MIGDMITINKTEFRKGLSKYLKLAKTDKVVVQDSDKETYELVPKGKKSDTDLYFENPQVLADIKEAKEDIKAGRLFEYDPATKTTKPYKPS